MLSFGSGRDHRQETGVPVDRSSRVAVVAVTVRVTVAAVAVLGLATPLFTAGPALAHKSGVSYSDIIVARKGGGGLRVDYTLRLCSHALDPLDRDGDKRISSGELAMQLRRIKKVLKDNIKLAMGGSGCNLELLGSSPERGGNWVAFEMTGACSGGGPLKIEYLLLATDRKPGYNLARITTEDGYREHIFTSEETEIVLGALGTGGGLLSRLMPAPSAGLALLGIWLLLICGEPLLSLSALVFFIGGWIEALLPWIDLAG